MIAEQENLFFRLRSPALQPAWNRHNRYNRQTLPSDLSEIENFYCFSI